MLNLNQSLDQPSAEIQKPQISVSLEVMFQMIGEKDVIIRQQELQMADLQSKVEAVVQRLNIVMADNKDLWKRIQSLQTFISWMKRDG